MKQKTFANRLTVSEAIVEGYTHCGHASVFQGDGGTVIPLDRITKYDLEESVFVLCEKNTVTFGISDGHLYDLLTDYLCDQDEVNNEDGILEYAAATVDFGPVTAALNEAFSKHKFYKSTEIQLIPDGQQ